MTTLQYQVTMKISTPFLSRLCAPQLHFVSQTIISASPPLSNTLTAEVNRASSATATHAFPQGAKPHHPSHHVVFKPCTDNRSWWVITAQWFELWTVDIRCQNIRLHELGKEWESWASHCAPTTKKLPPFPSFLLPQPPFFFQMLCISPFLLPGVFSTSMLKISACPRTLACF